MLIRALTRQDDLLELLTAALPYDGFDVILLNEMVWDDPDATPEGILAAIDGERLIGYGSGVIRPSTAHRGVVKILAVAEDRRGNGVGSALLEQLECQMGQAGADHLRLGESPPHYLVPGVDSRHQDALRFFANRSYRPIGETQNMSVALDPFALVDELQPSDPSLTIRRARLGDRQALWKCLEPLWPSWVAETAACFERRPISLHLASTGEQVVAFAAFDCHHRGKAWFGPMGTAPAWRGRGLGGLLLKRCLTDLYRAGHRNAVIPWVGPVDFYTRAVGARIDRVFHRFERVIGP